MYSKIILQLLLLFVSATVALKIEISTQMVRDILIREQVGLDKFLVDTITKRKYNKNLDLDYSSIRIEDGMTIFIDGSMRKGLGQVVGGFTLAFKHQIVPTLESYRVAKQAFTTEVSISKFTPRDDESVNDKERIVGVF